MQSNKLNAGADFPVISLPTLNGDKTILSKAKGAANDWRLVVVYRGKHCPLCTKYLTTLNELLPEFNKLGVDVVAVSGDTLEKATQHLAGLNLNYEVAYGLSVKQMQSLGLYISEPRSAAETDSLFAEPGLFIVNAEGKVQIASTSNSPAVRPELAVLARGLAFVRAPENNYPIRGTYLDK
jgi:peroxiredoxin